VKNLPTVIVWIFRSKKDPSDIRYFIKNTLFTSNWREKIRGMLLSFDFIEEQDTGIALHMNPRGSLEYESILAIHRKNEELRRQYRKLTGG
jgi:hypothetical protein